MGNTNSTPAPESEPASPPRSPTPPRAPTLPIPRMAPMPAMPEMPQTSPIPNTPSPNEHRQRNTVITTTHEAVRGTYTLSDSLSITTLSGSINITITLDPSQLSNPNITYSPHLTLKSTSGSIRVTMKDALPNSSTHLLLSTNLKTISGDIIATMPHSSETTILTTSGNVSAHLFTSLLTPREIKSHMGIETMSGDVHYTLSGPPGCKCDFGAAFDIQSRIRTVSGGVECRYPTHFPVRADMRSMGGVVMTRWPTLWWEPNGSGRGGVVGWQGLERAESLLRVESMSGVVRLFGEECGVVVDGEGQGEGGSQRVR